MRANLHFARVLLSIVYQVEKYNYAGISRQRFAKFRKFTYVKLRNQSYQRCIMREYVVQNVVNVWLEWHLSG